MAMIDSFSAIEDVGEGHKWFKLVFDVVDKRLVGNRQALLFRAMGGSPLGEIGFEAIVPLEDWKNRELIADLRVDWGCISLRSIGEPTDRLLALLEEQFGLPRSGARAVDKISCEAVFLGDDLQEIENEEMHAKLFFQGAAEADSYAQLYLNFDLARGHAWLMEKDQYYRQAVVGWLAGKYRLAEESVH